jgi:aspartyl protease family protein
VKGWVYALAVLAVVVGPALASAQQLAKCVAGQAVTDKEGKTGVILADDSKLCQVKYADGQVYSWIYWNLRPTEASAKSGLVTTQAPITKPPPVDNPEAVSVLRPSSNRTLVYRADGHGNFMLTAAVNGAPIRAVVDTGASLVALTLEDAQAAGISRSELVFSGITHTADGPARFAPVMLREVRIEQVSIENVPAAVMENLTQSLLGMSFLKRLKSFEMREGALTINW